MTEWKVLRELLAVARPGQQFPDASQWSGLLGLLEGPGPRGAALRVPRAPLTGLPTARALGHLHALQRIAREYFAAHRLRPGNEVRAFSAALVALELPPVVQTRARLVSKGKVARFQVVHEQLVGCAVRFTVTVDQLKGGHLKLGRDKLAQPSDALCALLRQEAAGGALEVFQALSTLAGLAVVEVVRGQLGPFVSGRLPLPGGAPADVTALHGAVGPQGAALSVGLERCGADVAATSLQDPWARVVAGAAVHVAQERRLFCTPNAEPELRAVVGRSVLIRST